MVANAWNKSGAFGQELKSARVSAGRTAAGLAASLAISGAHLSDVENGKRGPLGAEHDAAIHREIGIPVQRLEVLRALARGTVDVSGLDERAIERVIQAIGAAREGDEAWARHTGTDIPW